jgi:cellulose synthase (UDP-forming)
MSLLGSKKFWQTKMNFSTRCCYISGFGYYVATAINVIIFPLLPVALLLAYPNMIELKNYAILLPAFIYTYLAFPAWHRCRWRLEAWTVQMLYSWSHLFAFIDIARRRPMGWTATGKRERRNLRAIAFRAAFTCWSGGMAVLWVGMALYRGSERPAAFVPMALLGSFYLLTVARAMLPERNKVST